MKKLGRDMRLFVTVSSTLTQLSGQGNLTINRGTGSVDTSSKENFPYATSAPGLKTLTLTQAIIPDLPDAAFAAMKALDASGDAAVYQVREKPYATGDVVFECLMYTSFGDTGMGQGDAVSTTATLTAAAAPTTDEI